MSGDHLYLLENLNITNLDDVYSDQMPSRTSTIIGSVIMVIFLIPGILGNLWLIHLVVRTKSLQSNMINTFIASLCVNDLINLTLVQTQVVTSYIAHAWIQGTLLCALVPEINMILVGVSVWHHALIAVHRYLVVVHWLFYKKINKHLYKCFVIIGTRLVPILVSIVYMTLTIVKRRGHHETQEMSTFERLKDTVTSISYYSSSQLRCLYKKTEKSRISAVLILLLFVPCVIVLLCFTLVFIYVRKNAQRRKKSLCKQHRLFNTEVSLLDMQNSPSTPPVAGFQPVNVSPQGSEEQKSISKEVSDKAPIVKTEKVSDKKFLSRELTITAMFGVVFFLFLVGYAPYGIVRMCDSNRKQTPAKPDLEFSSDSRGTRSNAISPDIYVMLTVLYAVASCCNPLIFGLMNRDIRRESENYIRTVWV